MKIMYSSVFSVKAWLGPAAGSLGGTAIALLEVARFMVMSLIASIIIQGVPISFSSLLPATFYFIVAIVKSELPFCKSGEITITHRLQTSEIRVGVTSPEDCKMAIDVASQEQQQQQLQLLL